MSIKGTVPLIVSVLLWTYVGCGGEAPSSAIGLGSGQETPSVAPGNDLHVETASFAPGTDVENAAGTIRVVDGLKGYRDPVTFELGFQINPESSVYVIVPDADKTVLLLPLDVPDEAPMEAVTTGVVTMGTTSTDMYLSGSYVPEGFRQEGLKVVFSGKIGKKPFNYEGYEELKRIPLELTKIELIDDLH